MVSVNPLLLDPKIKHVTNVKKDIHVKLYGGLKRTQSSYVPRYTDSSFKVIKVPKPQTDFHSLPRTVVSAKSRYIEDPRIDSHQRTSTPAFDSYGPRLSSEFSKTAADNDSDNLSDEQKYILDDLDDTLNKYQTDDFESGDIPKIIADILPNGEFEPFDMDAVFPPDSGVESDEPSSRTSSVSNKSVNSRSGIISKRASTGSAKRKLNSVSFKLPAGHIDKPYSPLQTSQKFKQPVVPNVAVNALGMANDVQVVESASRRNSTGPFKGSFMKLFYKRYGETNVDNYNNQARYLTPKIMEKVESFESLVPVDIASRANFHLRPAPAAVVRRHTFR